MKYSRSLLTSFKRLSCVITFGNLAVNLKRQPTFTVATATTMLVAILLVDSYILINPYRLVSLGHDVGDLASARMAAVGDNNLYITWNDYLAGKHDILLAKYRRWKTLQQPACYSCKGRRSRNTCHSCI